MAQQTDGPSCKKSQQSSFHSRPPCSGRLWCKFDMAWHCAFYPFDWRVVWLRSQRRSPGVAPPLTYYPGGAWTDVVSIDTYNDELYLAGHERGIQHYTALLSTGKPFKRPQRPCAAALLNAACRSCSVCSSSSDRGPQACLLLRAGNTGGAICSRCKSKWRPRGRQSSRPDHHF
jgi:hypothetical protein